MDAQTQTDIPQTYPQTQSTTLAHAQNALIQNNYQLEDKKTWHEILIDSKQQANQRPDEDVHRQEDD